MSARLLSAGAVLASLLAVPSPVGAQGGRPRATLAPATPDVTLAAGAATALSIKVELPEGVHVQASQPKDPLLIPTVLTIDAPGGVNVESIAYPSPSEFKQAGREEPLLVLGPAFDIEVRLAVAPDTPPGVRSVPIVLRYQACNDSVCFPPAKTTSAWTLTVAP